MIYQINPLCRRIGEFRYGRPQHNGVTCTRASRRAQVWPAIRTIYSFLFFYLFDGIRSIKYLCTTRRSHHLIFYYRLSFNLRFFLILFCFHASPVDYFPNRTGVNALQPTSGGGGCVPFIVLRVQYIVSPPSRTIDNTVERTLLRFFYLVAKYTINL